jgi:5-oxoprolinase (ATP-hydrolysing)
VTKTAADEPLPPLAMRLATTKGTNALLERRGARVAFFVTRGFADLLIIGTQQRPDLFALRIDRPAPLHEMVVEIDERLDAAGSVVRGLDEGAARVAAQRAAAAGLNSAAIALLHSSINPAHENRLAAILRECGFQHIAVSSDLAPQIRVLPRAQTAVTEAFLAPEIAAYLRNVQDRIGAGRLHVMTSAGGLVSAPRYRAKDSLLSGPAGGVAGAAAAGALSGFHRVIGFDMGGTSTDVARFDEDFEYQFEHTVAGATLVAPALAIETVAAGGGSICWHEDGSLRVGPKSARAHPGPACFGAGGPLTLTDVNLLLGRVDPRQFEIPISREPAHEALARIAEEIRRARGSEIDDAALLEGFLAIADERMADAIAQVSIRRGYDSAEFALVAFGGAGGQHACAVAERLGIGTIVMPADASLLSALGLQRAIVERFAQQQVLENLDRIESQLPQLLDQLAVRALADVEAEGVDRTRIVARRRIVNLRLLGQDTSLPVEYAADLRAAFALQYAAMYGHQPEGKPVEVESLRVIACEAAQQLVPAQDAAAEFRATAAEEACAFFDGRWQQVPGFARSALRPGARLAGPAIVFDRRSTCIVGRGWGGMIDAAGALVLRVEPSAPISRARTPESARAELLGNRLTSIAQEMGQMLQRTALSTNIKERLDFSCAVLDRAGELLVNAPHIPVHLGGLGLCVRALAAALEMKPGDTVVTNDPRFGGSHLPDVTVVTPVHVEHGGRHELVGFVANRAHHAEIGGRAPGSMPPSATRLIEEGVIIEPVHLVRAGKANYGLVERLLRAGPFPSRAVADNLADLRAAVAANRHGADALKQLAGGIGVPAMEEGIEEIKNRAERLARSALERSAPDLLRAEERMDDGSLLRAAVHVRAGHATIDFEGTSPQHPGNLNATPAIVTSAVLYVLRLLIGERLPLNEGIMRAVTLKIPRGMLSPDFSGERASWPAVVGGNTETSQRVVDTLLKAFGMCACSQGTMNNVLFGNDAFGYYETICGGTGAGPGYHGADAVHTHMTNTRITDAEILERRYPVRVERFHIRQGSGGSGRHRGGCGVTRELLFLQPMALSVLTQHRVERPYGLDGGGEGAAGCQRVVRAGGEEMVLKSIDGCEVRAGDRLILETPGGGGFGPS